VLVFAKPHDFTQYRASSIRVEGMVRNTSYIQRSKV